MKKVLSVLCMALLAGGMIFTSCNKQYTITVIAEPAEGGTVEGGGTYNDQVTATLKAIPNDGYEFVQWNDGVKDNPRTITVTSDETYTAHFQTLTPNVYVSFNNDNYNADFAGNYITANHAWDVTAAKVNGQYPYADVCMLTGTATGSNTNQADPEGSIGNDKFGWVEYYLEGSVYYEEEPDVQYGDWWAKTATVNVSNFDATALTMTANVNAEMFDVIEALGQGGTGVAAAATVPMNVNMTYIKLNESAKGFTLKHHKGGKLVAAK